MFIAVIEQWVGLIKAILSLPEVEPSTGFGIFCCFVFIIYLFIFLKKSVVVEQEFMLGATFCVCMSSPQQMHKLVIPW